MTYYVLVMAKHYDAEEDKIFEMYGADKEILKLVIQSYASANFIVKIAPENKPLIIGNPNTKIIDAGFSIRTLNCLRRANFETLGDVVRAYYSGQILHIRNLGPHSLEEIKEKLLKLCLIKEGE